MKIQLKTFLRVKATDESQKVYSVESQQRILILKQDLLMNNATSEESEHLHAKDTNHRTSGSRQGTKETPPQPPAFRPVTSENSYAFYFDRIFSPNMRVTDIFTKMRPKNVMGVIKAEMRSFFLLGPALKMKTSFVFGRRNNSIKLKGVLEMLMRFFRESEFGKTRSRRDVREKRLSSPNINISQLGLKSRSSRKTLSRTVISKNDSQSYFPLSNKKESFSRRDSLSSNASRRGPTGENSVKEQVPDQIPDNLIGILAVRKNYSADMFEYRIVKYCAGKRFFLSSNFEFQDAEEYISRKRSKRGVSKGKGTRKSNHDIRGRSTIVGSIRLGRLV